MIVTRRPTFRLYPTPQQAKQWHDWRQLHCSLYNAAIANRKTQDKHVRHAVDDFEQQNSRPAFKRVWPEYAALGSQALQAPLQRVNFACQRFFKRQSGDPPFKSSRDYRGWTRGEEATETHGTSGFRGRRTPIRLCGGVVHKLGTLEDSVSCLYPTG